MSLDAKNLSIRALSGIVYIGLIIGAVLWGSVGVALLCSVFALIGIFELENMAAYRLLFRWRPAYFIDALIALSAIWSAYFMFGNSYGFPGHYLMTALPVLLAVRFLIQIFLRNNKGIFSIAISVFALIYLCIPLCYFIALEYLIHFKWIIVALISMIWINDTGAYLVGCTFGRHRLYEAISPKKSWEGFFGGIIFNIGAGVAFFYMFRHAHVDWSLISWIVVGICVSVTATVGDLFESMIKRNCDVKDSGSIIPGHGGILDRIDSLLFVVPMLVMLISIIR